MTPKPPPRDTDSVMVPKATVAENYCDCHQETCCCGRYNLLIDGERAANGSREAMQKIADAINRATPPAPDALPSDKSGEGAGEPKPSDAERFGWLLGP